MTSRMTAKSVGKSVGGDAVEKACEQASGGDGQGKAGEATRKADDQALPEKSFNDLAAWDAESETQANFTLELEVLFQQSKIVRGAHRIEIAKLAANRHAHGIVVRAQEEVRAGLSDGSTPIRGENGRVVETGFASGARDPDDFRRAGVAQPHRLRVMANHGGAVKVSVCESAAHNNRRRAFGFAASSAGEQRNVHGLKINGGDKAIFGDEVRLGLGAPFEKLEFGLISERQSRDAPGNSSLMRDWHQRRMSEVGCAMPIWLCPGSRPCVRWVEIC